jgi:glucose/arabinose dehydrogenase
MRRTKTKRTLFLAAAVIFGTAVAGLQSRLAAQSGGPTVAAPDLEVTTVISGLTTPIALSFLGSNDFLVLEKNTGRVVRVRDGVRDSVVLDLPVNFASERGLLGIALHPDFPRNPGVYLFWTCTAPAPPADNPFAPTMTECADAPGSGPDTSNILQVPLLGNRVDRFTWDGSTLRFDRNIIRLRAFQNDAAPTPSDQGDSAQPPAGNHNGGVIRFGPDRKLYIIFGDNGRRGLLQNLREGPGGLDNDDQFGGPAPDNAHLSGVILRLNDDGTTPLDNPFFNTGASMGGAAGSNLQKVFAYGIRNSFGMAFDPVSGALWNQENGDDTFDEINRVEPGMNSGWVQIIGPVSRIREFRTIEMLRPPYSLQQFRWPPANIAASSNEALSRLSAIPGSLYRDPQFSWRYAVAPAAIGFVSGSALGQFYQGNLFVAASRPDLAGGYLFRFRLNFNRTALEFDDERLEDGVADNLEKFDATESESLLIGRGFGVGTDIQTGPNGSLYIVSLSNGAVYELHGPRAATQ